MKICLHQWIRPQGPYIKVEGMGDCRTCTTHEDNKFCKNHCLITRPGEFEVKEKENAVYETVRQNESEGDHPCTC